MNDDFELLKAQSEGLGTRLAAGLVPQLSQALQIMSGDLKQTTEAWEKFGQGIGLVLKFIVAVVSSAFDVVGTALSFVMMRIDSSVQGGVGPAARQPRRGQGLPQDRGRSDQRRAERAVRAAEGPIRADHLDTDRTYRTRGSPRGGLLRGPGYALAAKRAQALQMTLDRELALVRSMGALRNAAEKRAFDQGLKDVRAYYEDRRRAAEEEFAKEIEVLEQKRALLDSEVDPSRRLQEQGKIDAELAKARATQEERIAALLSEERDAVQKLAQERLALEKTLLEAQGRRHEAALLGIDEEIRKTDLAAQEAGRIRRRARGDPGPPSQFDGVRSQLRRDQAPG